MHLKIFKQISLQLFTSNIPAGCSRLFSRIECCSEHCFISLSESKNSAKCVFAAHAICAECQQTE